MAITFRHDAAAVIPPSNQSTRKYGQSLVLQQQQQKYAGQQAGYDRLFTLGRDVQQNAFQAARDKQQNAFQVGRDKTLFEQQQQEAEAARQRKFLDEARQQSGRFILDAIENDEFDPATARALRQNMVAEAEALGNPQLDATQRAEAMAKIRAERSLLLSNRKPKAPPPSPTDAFKSGIAVDDKTGMRYQKNAKGDWVPLEEPEAKPQPPATAADAFKADPELHKQYIDDAVNALTEGGVNPLTPEIRKKAGALARELYDSDNQQPEQTPGARAPTAGQSQQPSASIAQSPPFAGLTNAIQGAFAGITGQTPLTVPQAPAAGQQNPWADVAASDTATPEPTQSQQTWDALQQAQAGWNNAYRGQNQPQPSGLTPEQQQAQSGWMDAYRGQGQAPPNTQPALPNPRLAPPSSGPYAIPDATPTGKRDAKGNVIMSDGSVADPRDAYAMQGKGMTDLLARNFNPDGSPVEYAGGQVLETAGKPSSSGQESLKQSSIKTTAPEAFSDLRKKFGDDTDSKNEISALEDAIRGNEAPEVQNAGLVVMQMLDKYGGKSPAQGSDDFNSLLEAMRALSNAGVDLKGSTSNAKYRDRAEAIKAANEKSRKRHGSRYSVTPEGM